MNINARNYAGTLIIVSLLCLSCTDSSRPPATDRITDTITHQQSAEDIEADLLHCNVAGDTAWQRFFNEWNRRIESNGRNYIRKNDTTAAVYEIFKTIYQPNNLLALGEWKWSNRLNEAAAYTVVQEKIWYAVEDSVSGEAHVFNPAAKEDSIINFRPPVALERTKVLYLTDNHITAINQFLGK